MKKAGRRFYALRKLRGCGVPEGDIVQVYCSLVRSIMEYASVVFSNLLQYLSYAWEKVPKSALAVIFPELDYEDALAQSGLCSLESRRVEACVWFIHNIQPGNPLYPLMTSMVAPRSFSYSLRSAKHANPVAVNTDRFRNFVTIKCGS